MINVLLHFKKEFSEIWDLCSLWDPIFLEKICQKIDSFSGIFQKVNVLRFKMVSNGKILKKFDEITYKTSHNPFLKNFKIIENF